MDFSTLLRRCGLAGEACVLDLDRLFERWRTIPDRRKPRGLRYPLWVLLSIATLAKLAGYHHPQAICDWARLRTQELCRLFRLWRSSMPALSTWDRVFAQALDADALEQVVGQFLTEALGSAPAPGCGVLAMDGKVMRGTIRLNRPHGTHLLALYQPDRGLVLAQAKIEAKANEISVASPLLNRVILRGWVVTGDAMFTQRELSLQIVAAGGTISGRSNGTSPSYGNRLPPCLPLSRLPQVGAALPPTLALPIPSTRGMDVLSIAASR